MKKNYLILLLGAALCFSSCMKEGDFDAFSGDLDITGEFNPTFGLPIATASVNLANLLGMVQEVQGYILFDPTTDNHLLYISYDTIIDTTLRFDDGQKASHFKNANRDSKETTVFVYDHPLRGETRFDIFKNIPSTNELSVDGVFANLRLFIKAFSDNSTLRTLIEQYHVNPYVDNVCLQLFGEDGTPHTLNIDGVSHIQGSQLVEGTWLDVVDTDFSEYINCRPNKIRYQLEFHVPVTASAAAAGSSVCELLRDSVKIDHMDLTADFSANFPLKFRCEELPYNVDLNVDLTKMGDVLAKIRKYLTLNNDSSFMFITFSNSMPIEIVISDQMLDASGNVILDEVTGQPAHLGMNGTATIPAADIRQQQAGSEEWVSAGAKEYVLQVPIGHNQLKLLEKMKKLRLQLKVSTSEYEGTAPHVSLRAEDHLGISAYIRSDANLHFSFPILGGDSNNNSK